MLAQTTRRKPAVNRTAPLKDNKQNVGDNASANLQNSQSGANNLPNPKLQPDAQVAVLETDYGNIIIELYPKLAPQMVARFKKLISEGFYNGTTFHRTSPSLGIIQGGDPNSKDADPSNDGYGKSPYPNLPAEFSTIPFTRGIVGAARANEPNSANSQFFFMLKRQSFFDNKYTVFGRVIEGLNNAYIISISPTERGTERPEDPVVVKRISLQLRKKFITGN
ncbi:MAG: peptidylprolyl isomerase [Acidobacteria bacterium]|nr:peptidylprolyl isomerase [Acidobacteriota bacterium]MCA1639055.1 peptidylprolyl isomerase [Acidobacteriota bacterium]